MSRCFSLPLVVRRGQTSFYSLWVIITQKSNHNQEIKQKTVWIFVMLVNWLVMLFNLELKADHYLSCMYIVQCVLLIWECRSIMTVFFIIYLCGCFSPPGHCSFLCAIQHFYLISSIIHFCPLVPLPFYIAFHMLCPALLPFPIYLH